MLHVPDFLYGLTPKDLAGQTLSINHDFQQQTLLAVQVLLFSPRVPDDRLWIVTHFAAHADAGGAQTLDEFQIEEVDDGSTVRGFIQRELGLAVGTFVQIQPGITYVVRPGNRLRYNFVFSAGVAGNLASISVAGFQIPRGNIQLVG